MLIKNWPGINGVLVFRGDDYRGNYVETAYYASPASQYYQMRFNWSGTLNGGHTEKVYYGSI